MNASFDVTGDHGGGDVSGGGGGVGCVGSGGHATTATSTSTATATALCRTPNLSFRTCRDLGEGYTEILSVSYP